MIEPPRPGFSISTNFSGGSAIAKFAYPGLRFAGSAGFTVAHSSPCDLPSDQRSITPAALFDWMVGHTPAEAEAVVIGGNGFRAVGAIAALEQALERPVVTANQALLWAALHAAGAATTAVTDCGRLFHAAAPPAHRAGPQSTR